MVKRESVSRLFCLLSGILTLGIVLLLVSAARVTAEGSALPSEASRVGVDRHDQGARNLSTILRHWPCAFTVQPSLKNTLSRGPYQPC